MAASVSYETELYSCPSSAAFRALLDNYETEAGHQEVVTDEEYQENWTFINLIMEAPVMQECHRYLASKGKADEDVDGFKKELYNMWFKLYKRKRQDRSVGWEWDVAYRNEMRGQIDGLVQDCSNSSALPMELLQSCTKPWICHAKMDESN